MSWVWDNSRSEGTDRLILLAIADFAADDGANAWPSIRRLAEKAKVTERTVQRAIRALTLLGEVSVDANAGRRGTNVYTINMRTDVTPSESHPVRSTPVQKSPRNSVTVTPVTPKGDTPVTRTIKEPSTTPQPPASGGHVSKKHCLRHAKFRRDCDHCQRFEAEATRASDEARRARENCQRCFGNVWLEDGTKCDHRSTA